MYSVLIPHIPANTSGSFSFRLKINVSIPTYIFVTTGEILNDIYFNAQEDESGTEIFVYELTGNFLIKKEALSQLIRNDINQSFSFSHNDSKKRLVNFIKLLNNSNCFNSSLRNVNEKGPVNSSSCNELIPTYSKECDGLLTLFMTDDGNIYVKNNTQDMIWFKYSTSNIKGRGQCVPGNCKKKFLGNFSGKVTIEASACTTTEPLDGVKAALCRCN